MFATTKFFSFLSFCLPGIEPATYLLLVFGQNIGRLRKKEENLVVANIEIQHTAVRSKERSPEIDRSLSLPEKRPESPRHIFC